MIPAHREQFVRRLKLAGDYLLLSVVGRQGFCRLRIDSPFSSSL
jgi:hypothetical protein